MCVARKVEQKCKSETQFNDFKSKEQKTQQRLQVTPGLYRNRVIQGESKTQDKTKGTHRITDNLNKGKRHINFFPHHLKLNQTRRLLFRSFWITKVS